MSGADSVRELAASVQRATMQHALDLIAELLKGTPDATATQARDRLTEALAGMPTTEDLAPEEYGCMNCDQAVAQRSDGKWTHRVDGRWSNVGCRAASFDAGGDWDDELDQKAKAKPTKVRFNPEDEPDPDERRIRVALRQMSDEI